MASDLHNVLAARITQEIPDDANRGAVLIATAHRLGLACAIFTPEEMGDTSDDAVEEAMITAGNNVINF